MDKRGLGTQTCDTAQKEEERQELTQEQREKRFNDLICPHYEFIKKLVAYYSDRPQDVDENFNTLLFDFYRYIHTYNGVKPLKTWIHSVVKNNVWTINKERAKKAAMIADAEYNSIDKIKKTDNIINFDFGLLSFTDFISDEVYSALLSLQPLRLSAFLLRIQGYSIDEITKIEYERGHLSKCSSDIIKNRIFWARKNLKEILISYGIKRKM